jgi:hypothetical protein
MQTDGNAYNNIVSARAHDKHARVADGICRLIWNMQSKRRLLHMTRWKDTKQTKQSPSSISPSISVCKSSERRRGEPLQITDQNIHTDSVDGQWPCQRCSQFVNRPQHRRPVRARQKCTICFRPLTSQILPRGVSFTDMIISTPALCFVG